MAKNRPSRDESFIVFIIVFVVVSIVVFVASFLYNKRVESRRQQDIATMREKIIPPSEVWQRYQYAKANRLNLGDHGADAHFQWGVYYFGKEDYDRAIADFTEAIRLEPNNAEAYKYRGDCYFKRSGNMWYWNYSNMSDNWNDRKRSREDQQMYDKLTGSR